MKYIIFLLFIFCVSLTLNAYVEPIDVDERLLEYEWLVRNFGYPDLKSDDDEFMKSLIQGDIKALRIKVEHGYDVNKKYENGITPLVYAVYYGNYDVVKTLIKLGADVNVSANSLVIDVLGVDSSEYAMAPILLATIRGDTKMVDLLLKSGADIEKKDSDDRTSLIWATCVGNVAMVNLLLKRGADIYYAVPSISISRIKYENLDSLSIACIRNDFPTVKVISKYSRFKRDEYSKYLFLSSDEDIVAILSKLLMKAKS